ncbi:MAG: hypothetical protein AAF193_01710, partial [Bacteroidota bacterium]
MAVEVEDPASYYSRIIVFGVKDLGLEDSTDRLDSLFEDHQYSEGLSVLKLDTATNNTEDEISGYNPNQANTDESHAVHCEGHLYSLTKKDYEKNDGQRFSEALGLDPELFQNVKNGGGELITNSRKLRECLFPGTLGAHLQEMWDTIITEENYTYIQDFFNEHTVGMGNVPSIQIGNQPYGLVISSRLHHTHTAFDNKQGYDFQNSNGFRLFGEEANLTGDLDDGFFLGQALVNGELNEDVDWKARFYPRMKEFLKHLDLKFREVAQAKLKNVYEENVDFFGINDPEHSAQKHFLQLMRLSPYSLDYYARHGVYTGVLETAGNMDPDIQAGVDNTILQSEGYDWLTSVLHGTTSGPSGFPKGLFHLNSIPDLNHGSAFDMSFNVNDPGSDFYAQLIRANRIFTTQHDSTLYKLQGGKLRDLFRTNSEPHSDWLNYLGSTHPSDLMLELHQHRLGMAPGSDKSKSLYYKLMRHSLLHVYRDAGFQMLKDAGLTDWQNFQFLGAPETAILEHHPSFDWTEFDNFFKFSKWGVLFAKFDMNFINHLILSVYNPQSYVNGPNEFANHQFSGPPIWFQMGLDYDELNPLHIDYMSNEILNTLIFQKDDPADGDSYETSNWTDYLIAPSLIGLDDGIPVESFTLADLLFQDFSIHPSLSQMAIDTDLLNPSVYSSSGGLYAPKPINKINRITQYLMDLGAMQESDFSATMASTLDSMSHRLDAWISGLFHKKLSDIRDVGITQVGSSEFYERGSHYGAYGYVENLSMKPQGQDETSDGFVMTTSVDHAVTAAVLRSGYLSSVIHEKSDLKNRMAVSLSSKRVRTGLNLLDGVRNGQDLEEILGSMLETEVFSYLDEHLVLSQVVTELRKGFPNRIQNTSNASTNAMFEFGNVCNGLAIVESVDLSQVPADTSISAHFTFGNSQGLLQSLGLDGVNLDEPAYNAFILCLEQVHSSFDAFADLAISEGVFQIVKGNTERASAYMSMMGGSRTLIEPEIVKTKNSGITFEQKVVQCIEFAASYTDTNGWTGTSPLADANPSINNWLQTILPDASNIKLKMRYQTTD